MTERAGPVLPSASQPPSGPVPIARLRQRRDFLQAARGRKAVTGSLVLQMVRSDAAKRDDGKAHFGFTATKKLGNAVMRNRTRRRLKSAVATVAPSLGRPGQTYVLIGRHTTATAPFARIVEDLRTAFDRVHAETHGPR